MKQKMKIYIFQRAAMMLLATLLCATGAWAEDYTDDQGVEYTINGSSVYVSGNGDGLSASITIPSSVTIPNSVTSIGEYAFLYCTSLATITIPNSVTSIGRYAFHNTAWLNSQSEGVVYAGKVAYTYKGDMPENTEITLANDTKGIAEYAFEDRTNLTSLSIPSSVTSIGGFVHNPHSGTDPLCACLSLRLAVNTRDWISTS